MSKPVQFIQCAKDSDALFQIENFESLYEKYFNDPGNKIFSAKLNEKIEVVDDADDFCSHCGYEPSEGNRVYASAVEMVWCFIVIELVNFRYTSPEIHRIKIMLTQDAKKFSVKMPPLEFCLSYCLREKKPLVLIVGRDGKIKIVDAVQQGSINSVLKENSCIAISIPSLLHKALPEFEIISEEAVSVLTSEEIVEVLHLIQEGRFNEITLQMDKSNRGKIQLIEALEIITGEKKIEQLKREYPHQEITLKQNGFGNEYLVRKFRKKF